MKKILKFTSIVFFLTIISACATTANYQHMLNNWQGARMTDLINHWGYPDSAIKLPSGNTVYMYTHQQLYTMPTPMVPSMTFVNVNGTPIYATGFVGGGYGGQTQLLYCRTWFEVNRNGVIVNSQFQGNNCVR